MPFPCYPREVNGINVRFFSARENSARAKYNRHIQKRQRQREKNGRSGLITFGTARRDAMGPLSFLKFHWLEAIFNLRVVQSPSFSLVYACEHIGSLFFTRILHAPNLKVVYIRVMSCVLCNNGAKDTKLCCLQI